MTGSVTGIRRRRTVAGRRETSHLPPDRAFYGQTLSTKYIAREKGTIPQNINYAVKSRHIVAALEDSDIDFEATNLSYDNHNNYQKLVDKASAATVLVFTE